MSEAIPAAAAAAAAGCIRALPEDVVFEILARVPDAVSLFRCAVVCKWWRRLVAELAFLRRRIWPESSLVGFFVLPQDLVTETDADGEFTKLAPTGEGLVFVPAAAALGLGPERRRLTSFVRNDAGVPLDQARALVARDGLLLVRLPLLPGDKKTVLRMCVCNLITGRFDLLPPLDGLGLIEDSVGGYAILTAADHGVGPHRTADGYNSFFQVLLTGVRSTDLQGYLARFSTDSSAASPNWYWRHVPEFSAGPYGSRVAAVSHGTAHWIIIGAGPNWNGMQILDVGITGHVGATEIPYHALADLVQPDWSNTWLCPSIYGGLSFFYLDNNQLRVWSQEYGDEYEYEYEDGDGDENGDGDEDQAGPEVWHLTQAIQVGKELGLDGIESLSTVCIGEKSSTMLAIKHRESDHAYVLHLPSRSSIMVPDWKQSFNYVPPVPYEMNWSEFFMARLGVQE